VKNKSSDKAKDKQTEKAMAENKHVEDSPATIDGSTNADKVDYLNLVDVNYYSQKAFSSFHSHISQNGFHE